MRTVALNLDVQDAVVLERAVIAMMTACDCRQRSRRQRCDDCAALGAILADLSRMLAHDGARSASDASHWSIPDDAVVSVSPCA